MKANYNRKRKKIIKETDRKAEAIWLACLAAYLPLRVAASVAALHGSEADLPLYTAAAVVFSGTFLFFAWRYETRPPKTGGVLVSVFAITEWCNLLPVPYKAALALAMLTLAALVGYSIWLALKRHRHYNVLLYAAALELLTLLLSVHNYTMADEDSLKFVIIGGVVGTLALAVGIYLLASGKLKAFDMEIADKAALLFGCLALGFIITYAGLYHANCFFDVSAPTIQQTVVLEKDISAGARRHTEYVLTVRLGDTERDVYVSETDYAAVDIGDSLTLEQHSGALGEAYYLLQ